MASNWPLTPGLSASPLWWPLLVSPPTLAHDPLRFFTLLLVGVPFSFSMLMTWLSPAMTLSILPLLRLVFVCSFLWLISALFATYLGLRFPPLLMDFISPKKNIFRISLLVLLLVMSVLSRLLWSSMFSFVLMMVILSLIRHAISSSCWEPCLSSCHSPRYILSYTYSESVCLCSHLDSQ
jgi:hypothetical protein